MTLRSRQALISSREGRAVNLLIRYLFVHLLALWMSCDVECNKYLLYMFCQVSRESLQWSFFSHLSFVGTNSQIVDLRHVAKLNCYKAYVSLTCWICFVVFWKDFSWFEDLKCISLIMQRACISDLWGIFNDFLYSRKL